MKAFVLFTIVLGFVHFNNLNAQEENIKADPRYWTTHNSTATFEKGSIHLVKKGEGSALLWLNDINFENGTVELEIKGKDVRGQSFLGLAFHGSDNERYDAVYFRPFNFKNSEKKYNSVQYINAPENVWHVLRNRFPGKYENVVNPVPDPNDWFHIKITIDTPNIKVYLNGSEEPTLAIEKISTGNEGKLGLWIDSKDGWFRNVRITPKP
ncbi:MAG: family 16 glycoside hydrolase [Bacteroidota bacterium]